MAEPKHMGTDIHMHRNQLLSCVLENLATAPSSPQNGLAYYDTVLNCARVYTNGAWVNLVASVTSVGVTAPIATTGGTTPTISITAATAGAAGSMSAADKAKLDAATNAATATTLVMRDGSGDFAGNIITAANLRSTNAPSGGTDVTNKNYVDALFNGTDVKTSVRAASTANVNVANPGTAVFDGVTLANGERLLLKNQTTASQNGLYQFNGSGVALTRTADADASAEVTSGLAVWVSEGSTNANTYWILTTADPIVLGTTGLTFTQFGSGTAYTNGTGITIAGNVISIATGYVGQTSITTLGTITVGTWNGTAVALTYGGSGVDASTTAGKKTARDNFAASGYFDAGTIGNGSLTSFTITQATHGMRASGGISVLVREVSTGARWDVGDVCNMSTGDVTLTFNVAPTTNQFRVFLKG